MNIFNRVLAIVLFLLLIAVSVLAIVNIYVSLFTWDEIPSLFVGEKIRANTVIITVIFVAIFIISIFLLVLEFYRRRPQSAFIGSDDKGKSMITTQSISREIDRELMKFDEIRETKTKAVAVKNKVSVDIFAKIIEGQELKQLTGDIRKAINDFMTQKLGVDVAKIKLTITGFIPEKSQPEPELSEEDLIISQVKEALLREQDQPGQVEEEAEEE